MSVLRQTVRFSPLGEKNQERMEKTAMKMMEMRRDQLEFTPSALDRVVAEFVVDPTRSPCLR